MLPSAAIEELENDVGYLIPTILSMRSFAGAKEVYDRHTTDKNPKKQPLPKSAAIDLVKEIELAAAKKDIKAAKTGKDRRDHS